MEAKQPKGNLNSRTKSGFAWLLSGSMVQAVMQVLFTAVLARLLSPSDFGLIASAMIVVGFADLFSQMGVGPALVQTKTLSTQKISTAFAFSVGLGVFLVAVFLLVNPLIAAFFEMPDLLPILNVLVFLFPIKSFTQLSFSLLQREFEFKKLAGLDVVSYIVGYGGVGITLAYMDYGVWALVYGILVQSLLYSLLLYWRKPHRLSTTIDRQSLRELLAFGKGFTLARFFNYLALKGDYLVVGKLLGADSLGFYSRAYGLMNAPNNIVGKVINTVMFSNFSEIQDDRKRITKTIRKSFELLFFFIIPISGLCWLLADDIVQFLLGDQWGAVVLPFRILVLGMIFRLGYKLIGVLLKGVGDVDAFARSQFFYMLGVILGSWLGSYYGLIGVAIAINLSLMYMFLSLVNIASQYCDFDLKEVAKLTVRPSLLTLLVVGFVGLCLNFIPGDWWSIYRLIISGMCTLLILAISYKYLNQLFKIPRLR